MGSWNSSWLGCVGVLKWQFNKTSDQLLSFGDSATCHLGINLHYSFKYVNQIITFLSGLCSFIKSTPTLPHVTSSLTKHLFMLFALHIHILPSPTGLTSQFKYNTMIFLYTQVEPIYGFSLFDFNYLRLWLQLFEVFIVIMTFSLLLCLCQAEIRYLWSDFHSYFIIWINCFLSLKWINSSILDVMQLYMTCLFWKYHTGLHEWWVHTYQLVCCMIHVRKYVMLSRLYRELCVSQGWDHRTLPESY